MISLCAAAFAATPARMAVGAGELLRITHRVADVAATAKFYSEVLGMEQEATDSGVLLHAADGAGLRLELLEGGAFQAEAGYQGLSARVPSVASAVEAITASGGSVLHEPAMVEHGPSLVPDEAEENRNEVLEAVVADPSGYPLLLHECADADAACLTGARLDVHEWKTSQEWWESLGWTTLRWNSNVHREASLTITVGANAVPADEPVGPRGSASAPVLQLTYAYGCRPIAQPADGALASLVLAAADGTASELADPDGYKVLLE